MKNKIWFFSVIFLFVITLVQADKPSSKINQQRATGTWTWQNPLPQGNKLDDVWVQNSSSIYAVGDYGTVIYYNGSSWSTINTYTTEHLYSVWGVTAAANIVVIAVGANGTILFITQSSGDKNSKKIVKSNKGTVTTEHLYGVWGTGYNDIYAVGANGTIIHYDGSSWITVDPGFIATQDLYCVWGLSASSVYVTGSGGALFYYNGTSWEDRSGNLDTSATIYAIWGTSSSNLYAGGGWENYDEGVLFHYSHGVWSQQIMESFLVKDVWGYSLDNVYAVGRGEALYSAENDALIFQFSSGEWHEAYRSETVINFLGIHGNSQSDIKVVGEGGQIMRDTGDGWALANTEITRNIHGIWGSSSSNVYAVFSEPVPFVENEKIIHYNGTSWEKVTSWNHYAPLYAIWGYSSNAIFAVGEDKTIVYYRGGSSWHEISNEVGGPSLYGVWGTSGTRVYAVGESDIILQCTYSPMFGWVCTTVHTGGDTLYGIWGSSYNNIFAVGEGGIILHYDGEEWSRSKSKHRDLNFYGICGRSESDVFVVGSGGTILHYDGSSWSSMDSGVTSDLYGIWGNSNNMYAVGKNGTFLFFDGTSWSRVTSNIGTTFLSVWGIPARGDTPLIIGGEDGSILEATVADDGGEEEEEEDPQKDNFQLFSCGATGIEFIILLFVLCLFKLFFLNKNRFGLTGK